MTSLRRSLFASSVAAAIVLAASPAFAGSSTISVKDGAGASKTYAVTTDGSSNFLARNVICDQSAGANCAAVDANNALNVSQPTASRLNATVVGTGTFAVQAAESGTWTVQPGNTPNTTPWLASINDGTNTAKVQAASTAAVAADKSLVTNESPNSQLSVAMGTTADAACGSDNGTCSLAALLKRNNQNLTTLNTSVGSAVPAGSNLIGYTSNDVCAQQNVAKVNVPISTASGNVQLVAGVSAKKIYVCSFSVIAATAISVSLSEGTGAACNTANQAAVMGVAANGTAANGLAFPANGGLTYGNGAGTVAQTATAANGLCLVQSGTAALAGNITYVQQ